MNMKMRNKVIFAVFSGLLAAISLPTAFGRFKLLNLGLIAWVAFVPLFYAIRGSRPRESFLITFLAAFVFYGISFYWIYIALSSYGGVNPVVSIVLLILMIVILSAYLALGPFLARITATRIESEDIILFPIFWVAVALVRNFFPFGGFPWNEVYESQYRFVPVIQIADIVGVYGITFIIIWVNQYFVELLLFLRGKKAGRFVQKTVATILLAVFIFGYGFWRVSSLKKEVAGNPSMTIGVVQGNVHQGSKWEEGLEEDQFARHIGHTISLFKNRLDLVIWPEASYPWVVPLSDGLIPFKELGVPIRRESDTPWLLIGALSSDNRGKKKVYYNSSLLINGKGMISGRYHKSHLVPFGEYIPLRRLLFFAEKLAKPAIDLVEVKEVRPLKMGVVKIAPLICYEDIFPEISRRHVLEGAGLLINQTNDAWYDLSSAAYQHLAISVFRAIENRRYLVRAANTGISAIIDPFGRILVETALFQEGVITSSVRLGRVYTTYTLLGDWFAFGCLGLAVIYIAVAVTVMIRRKIRVIDKE